MSWRNPIEPKGRLKDGEAICGEMPMKVRSGLASRKLLVAATAMAATLGMIGSGPSATGDGPATATPVRDEKAKAKSDHPSITVLRNRLLASFHGQTTDLFTALPGFGMERMRPLYKYVPFEIPDLSTNEVEVEKEIVPPDVLKDLFAKSRDAFHDPGKPLPAKRAENIMPLGFGPMSRGGVIVRGLQLRLLDLVGLTNPAGPMVYSGGKAFEVQRMSAEEAKAFRAKNPGAELDAALKLYRPTAKELDAKADHAKLPTRPLDVFETAGVAELSQGKDLFIRNRDDVIRMLGALRAGDQCVKCHTDSKKGDLLGALSYTFVDTNKALEKKIKGTSAQ
jgi:hypothetical protein